MITVSFSLCLIYEELIMKNINENILFTYHIKITPTKEFQPAYEANWNKLKDGFEELCTRQKQVKASIIEMTKNYIKIEITLPKGYHRNKFANTLKKQSYEYLSAMFPELPCVLDKTCWRKKDWAKSIAFINKKDMMKYINDSAESNTHSPNVA